MEIISRGAEAVIYKTGNKIIKERVRKGYRILKLDEDLRKKRTRLEVRIMNEAKRAGAEVPSCRELDENKIEMDFIEGDIIKNILDKKNSSRIGKLIGAEIGKLHSSGIIHGDLTTSNMILSSDESKKRIFFIDFGLGFRSQRTEDKAIDLYVLKETITATHNSVEGLFWKAVEDGYKNAFEDWQKVIKTLLEIEKRGRYRRRSEHFS